MGFLKIKPTQPSLVELGLGLSLAKIVLKILLLKYVVLHSDPLSKGHFAKDFVILRNQVISRYNNFFHKLMISSSREISSAA